MAAKFPSQGAWRLPAAKSWCRQRGAESLRTVAALDMVKVIKQHISNVLLYGKEQSGWLNRVSTQEIDSNSFENIWIPNNKVVLVDCNIKTKQTDILGANIWHPTTESGDNNNETKDLKPTYPLVI